MYNIKNLKKTKRLNGKEHIKQIFKNGISFSIEYIRIIYLESKYKKFDTDKIGISVSKKLFKRAVDRNRIKRLIKTSYALNKYILKKNHDRSYKIVFLYKKNLLVQFDKINIIIKKILYQLI